MSELTQNLRKKLDVPASWGGQIQCPHCQRIFDSMSADTGKAGAKINPFTIIICVHCGGISWYHHIKGVFCQATDDDLEFMLGKSLLDIEYITLIRQASALVKQSLAQGQQITVPQLTKEIEKLESTKN